MTGSNEKSFDAGEPSGARARDLRRRAEKKAAAMDAERLETLSPGQVERLVHELRVHQIELELQNEELRRAQLELEASRTRYFSLYDLAPAGYVTIDGKGLITEANLAAATLLAAPRSALCGKPLSRFILPEDQDTYYRHRKALVETQKTQVCELRLDRPPAEPPVWIRLQTALDRDKETGAAIGRAVMVDITNRKLAEEALVTLNQQLEASNRQLQDTRQRLQASDQKLQQAQKLEAVGRLAGGVAHDYNNMLGVIFGYTELAMEKVDPSESLYADLKAICDAARRSSEITRQLLAFARKQTISPKVIDVNKTVEGTLNMIRHLIGEDIHLEWMPGTGLWPLKIDPSQLDQVLANLCVNARDAIRDVGKVVIETGNVTFDKAFCADHPEFCQGDFVMLQVSDNGRGMDKETLDNVFEPFFTTKEVGKGTGLGLAMVYGIVKQNEGFINVYSEPGKGAAFKIYLPRHEGPIGEAAKRGVAPVPRGRGETVLVVEDDGLILKLAEKILLGLDYTVLTAGTSDEALGFARQHAGRIHLLITDVIMPMMNGRELANQVQQLCPDIKTLFMSGYTANIIAHRGVLDEGINFIQKPFSIQNLANAVRNLLDA
jgi:PAS domain S-box-containing protein